MGSAAEPRWAFTGPVKWVAVGVVFLAGIAGIAGVLWSRAPRTLLPLASVREEPVHPAPSARAPDQAKPAPASVEKGTLNVNAATRGELELLPGIGPALAGRIIDYRQQHGPLRGMGDLDKVRGIGPKLIERLRPLVRFE